MVGRPANSSPKIAGLLSLPSIDGEIATTIIALCWAAILWQILHPMVWPIAAAVIDRSRWPGSQFIGKLLYCAGCAGLWWIPVRQSARLIACEADRLGTWPSAVPTSYDTCLKLGGHFPVVTQLEVDMRHAIVGIALFGIALATSVTAQPTSYSTSNARTLVATGELPTVSAMPLYFRVLGATISSNEEISFSAGNGILYQLVGTTQIVADGNIRTIKPGEGMFVSGGSRLALKALGSEPSTYILFLVSPASYLDQPAVSAAVGREIYRSTSPIPGLKQGGYLLNLSKVTVPPYAPSDRPHRRSGAALHCVLTGFGAETVSGVTMVKRPGSISYEPSPLVYQWGNPGSSPLTYLVFNLNPKSEEAVVVATSASD